MKSGLWTICLHPNEMEESGLRTLDRFLAVHAASFPDPRDTAAQAVPYGPTDAFFAAAFRAVLQVKRTMTKRKVR